MSRRIVCPIVAGLLVCCTPVRLLAQQVDGDDPPADEANVSARISVTDEGLLELHARNADLDTVLRLLSAQGQQNIVSGPDVDGTVTADLYGVTMAEALDAILNSNRLAARQQGKFIYVYTIEQLHDIVAAETPMINRVFILNYIPAAEAATLISPLLSSEGRIAQSSPAERGVQSDNEDAGGDSLAVADTLVVFDYADYVERIEQVIRQIDVRPKQVLIEATILRATLNDLMDMGVDFNVLSGVNFEMIGSTSPGLTNLVTGDVPPALFRNTSWTMRTDFADQVPAGGFTFGIIHDRVAGFIRALEQVTDVTVMANPKILAVNKQRGEVIVGRRDGYLTTTVTETTAVQTVEFLETGTQLVFRPYIGDDGYVRMELHPEDSNGGLTPANLPFEETTEATTNILVRDGHTILIAGLFRERTSVRRSQVPLLGSIPVLNVLGRRSADETTREEVIILLTVHIIKDTDAEMELNAELADEAEQIRVGARRGVMGIGRERLAQTYYHDSVKAMENGRLSHALFSARMALYLHPRMQAARQIKESILQRRDWEHDGGRMREFIFDLIAAEKGEPLQHLGRPPVMYQEPLEGDQEPQDPQELQP